MTIAELFGTLFLGGFGANIVLFMAGLALVLAVIMFTHRFGSAEAILTIGVFGWGAYALNIHPLFTGVYALILFGISIIVVYVGYTMISNK